MDLLAFGAACKTLERVKAKELQQRANAARAAYHADKKQWEAFNKQFEHLTPRRERSAKDFAQVVKNDPRRRGKRG